MTRFGDVVKALVVALLVLPTVSSVEFEPTLLWGEDLNSTISTAALSPDGNHFALGHYDGSIEVFNRSFDLAWAKRLDESVKSVSISSGGDRLLAASGSKLRLYEGESLVWERDLGFLKDSSLSGNGRGVAYASAATVTYIDTALKDPIKARRTFFTETTVESVFAYATSSYRIWSVAAGDQKSVYLFSREGFLWSYPVYDRVTDVAISPDGGFVAAGTEGGYVYLFSRDGSLLWTSDMGSTVYGVSISQEAGYAAVGTTRGAALFSGDGEAVWTLEAGPTLGTGISSRGDRLFAAYGKKIALFKVPDVRPASLEITSPEEGATVSGLIDVGVKALRTRFLSIKFDGIEVSRRSFAFDTRLVGNGWHTISVEASDFSDNRLERAVEVYVDNGAHVPPPVTILGIDEGDILSGSRRINVISNLPFEELAIKIDGEEVAKGAPFDWNTRAYAEGAHEVEITAKLLGESYSVSALVFVDNIPDKVSPAVKIFQPFPGERLEGTRAIRAVFEKQPAEVYVKIDDEIVSNSLPYVWDLEGESPGSHEITVYALDEAGNIGVDSSTAVRILSDDPDGDGWSNELERLYRTDPQNPDTDGDGIIDSADEDPLRDYGPIYTYLYIIFILLLLSVLLIKNLDLRFLLLVTLIAAILITVQPFNTSPFRIPFALFLVFYSSGYAFISALFPKKEISLIERFTLSVAFSIAIFVFNGFALNYTWGFRTLPIVVTISGITLAFAVGAAVLRDRYPKTERFSIQLKTPRFPKESLGEIEKALIIALVLSIVISGAMLVYAKLTFEHEEFSALYILGEGGKAEDYNKGLYLGEPETIGVGVENYERVSASYRLEVRLNDVVQNVESFSLDDKERWIKEVSFTPDQVSARSKLEFLLYKGGGLNPYRSVHLWVTSTPNFADPSSFESYSLKEIPIIENYDFELNDTGWQFFSTNRNLTGGYSNETYVSSPYSYRLSVGGGVEALKGSYGVIVQEILSEETGLAVLSFNVLDSYRGSSEDRYLRRVLLNGRVVWEMDVAGNRGWERFAVPVMMNKGSNTLEFRLYQKGQGSMPIAVWWDDVKFEPAEGLVVL